MTDVFGCVERRTRIARRDDAATIAEIYNEGIDDRDATFETEHRTAEDADEWVRESPTVVVCEPDGAVIAWASAAPYSDRDVYDGVGEFSVYARRDRRGSGAGKEALAALIDECERRGYWKLVAKIFPENEASRALCRDLGCREIGVFRRHAKLDGEWHDCVVVERLLGEGADAGPT